jgi:hypothetical protein
MLVLLLLYSPSFFSHSLHSLVLLPREIAGAEWHLQRANDSNSCKPLILMPLGTAKLGGIVFSKHLYHLAQNAIPNAPLHDKCAGEETNATAINPVGNPVDGDGRLLLHLPWHPTRGSACAEV